LDFGEFSFNLLWLLFFVAIVAGFIDTLAGGGGLITMPALMISGVPPLTALGTNKLQGSVGSATATFMMLKHKRITWHEVKCLMLFSFAGSALGAIVVQWIDTAVLSFIIPLVLFVIAVYFSISPIPHEHEGVPRISIKLYQRTIVPVVGAYDGMFGPGAGSFFSFGGIVLRGQSLLKATATAKALNFASNIASLIVFIAAGKIVWLLGGAMMGGQVIGAWLGSHCLFKINRVYLRVIVVFMCVGMLIKYSLSLDLIQG